MNAAAQPSLLPAFDLEMTGVLLETAHHAVRQLDTEGHVVPVLCMDLQLDNAHRTRAHIEQPFPAGHDAQCKAAARRLKRGTRITFSAPLVGVPLHIPNVTHIHVHTPEESHAR